MKRKWYESAKLLNVITDDEPEKMLTYATIAAVVPVEHAQLGFGCNTFTGDVRGKALIADSASINLDVKQGGQDKLFYLKHIQNKYELSKKMEVSAAASYSGFFSASAKSNFVSEQNFKSESVFLLVGVEVTNRRTEFKEYKPSEGFTKFFSKDPINWNEFLKIYGNEFIFSIATGGEFYALYEFHFESIQDKEEFEVKIKGSGWVFKSEGEFKNALDKIDTDVNITCNLYIRGGKGKLPEVADDKIIEAARQFPEAVDPDGGAPIAYKAETKDYYVVENFPGFPDDIDENLNNNLKICDNINKQLAQIEVLEQSDLDDPSDKEKLVAIKDDLIDEIPKITKNPTSRHEEPTHLFDGVKEIESKVMWTLVPGQKLTQISVGTREYVWGVSSDQKIWQWKSDKNKWEICQREESRATNISVGSDGTTWHVNRLGNIYRWKTDRWEKIPGQLKQISVGSDSHVWGINKHGLVYQWVEKNGKWAERKNPQKEQFDSLSVASDGTVILLNKNNQVLKWNKEKTLFEQISGELFHISVGKESEIWGIDTKSQVVKWEGETWKPLPSNRKLKSISVGGNGEVWGVDGQGDVFRLKTELLLMS